MPFMPINAAPSLTRRRREFRSGKHLPPQIGLELRTFRLTASLNWRDFRCRGRRSPTPSPTPMEHPVQKPADFRRSWWFGTAAVAVIAGLLGAAFIHFREPGPAEERALVEMSDPPHVALMLPPSPVAVPPVITNSFSRCMRAKA